MKVFKFSTPTCGQCRVVGSKMKRAGIEYEEVDCTTGYGALRAGHYNISHVPVVIIVDDDDNEVKRFSNLPAILKAISAGDISVDS